MKTIIPDSITTIDQAKAFLTDLYNNGESFHPEDDAMDCLEGKATPEEGKKLNERMADIYNLEGNNGPHDMSFDPCEFLLNLDPEYAASNLNDLNKYKP